MVVGAGLTVHTMLLTLLPCLVQPVPPHLQLGQWFSLIKNIIAKYSI